ncbi:MAG: iron-sulfur cluster assembly accessory protein [Proteobacteria bacterium]|nr:iron-sulfur cluster assembly accessory protein [Pseudomonadota bacterium]
MINLTESAAQQIEKVRNDTNAAEQALRVDVVDGGCSGHQYKLGFDSEHDGDERFESHGVALLVNKVSAEILDGVEIDYVENLEGSTFTFSNPKATGGCGCGKSFSV